MHTKHTYTIKHMYILGLGKRFKCLNLHLFAAHSKLNFFLQSFETRPTSALVQSKCDVNNVHGYVPVDVLMLAASVSFLSTVM